MRHRKTKKRGGGWFDSITGSATDYWSSASSSLSGYNPFKKNETTPTPTTTPSTTYTPPPASYGGRKRRTRHKRGGGRDFYSSTIPLSPAPYHSTKNISYNLVGGKTRKHRKSRKSRKY